jgi:hypothetical protein
MFDMKRRDFITLLGGGSVAARGARAAASHAGDGIQQVTPVIGFMSRPDRAAAMPG